MKYRNLFLLGLLAFSQEIFSQIMTHYYEEGNIPDSIQLIMDKITPAHMLLQPPSNVQELIQKRSQRSSFVPVHFGERVPFSLSLRDGIWTDTERGRIWATTIESKGAKSLSFAFNVLSLPLGGRLVITNKDGSIIYGPVTQRQIPDNKEFLTNVIQGEMATIYLFEPKACIGQSKLKISHVIYGFREITDYSGTRGIGSSSSCNVDVACHPEYASESQAIAIALVEGGTAYCSGALIMSTDHSFTPYFLSAFHCIDINEDGVLSTDEKAAVNNWVVSFQYKKLQCGQNEIANTFGYYGAIFRAAWKDTDFALVEINDQNDDITDNPHLRWLGWDRSGNTPTGGACLHHPQGDVMKVSISDCQFVSTHIQNQNALDYWKVTFDEGIIEPGSSGAPILNQTNKIVGQLKSGHTSGNPCNWNEGWFGKFSKSWTGGGTSDTRLSNWLDPIGTNQTSIESSSPLYLMSISGPIIPETYSTYSVNVPYSNCSVSWRYTGNPLVSGNDTITANEQFAICNPMKQYIKGKITATVYRDGEVLTTLEKAIHTGANFSGTYSQAGGQVLAPNGGTSYFDPVANTAFSDGDVCTVHRQHQVTLTSPLFSGSTVTCTSSYPPQWSHTGYTITFNMPIAYQALQYDFIGKSNNGYDVYKFTIKKPQEPAGGIPHTLDGNTLVVSLPEEVYADPSDTRNILGAWEITIVNANTGMTVYNGRHQGNSLRIPTLGWNPGVYSMVIAINDLRLTDKIIINK